MEWMDASGAHTAGNSPHLQADLKGKESCHEADGDVGGNFRLAHGARAGWKIKIVPIMFVQT